MCFANLGTLICQACGWRVGEQLVGMTPCWAMCGKFVWKVTDEVIQSECRVCHDARAERADLARRLTRASGSSKEAGTGPGGDCDADDDRHCAVGRFPGTNGKEDGGDEDGDGDELTSQIPSIIA